MKTKIVLLTLFLVIAFSNINVTAQRVYIKVITANPTIAKTNVYIYENGATQTKEIESNK